eukprot:3927649-Amphidinium_carterae.1
MHTAGLPASMQRVEATSAGAGAGGAPAARGAGLEPCSGNGPGTGGALAASGAGLEPCSGNGPGTGGVLAAGACQQLPKIWSICVGRDHDKTTALEPKWLPSEI